MIARRRTFRTEKSHVRFQPVPLVAVFLSLIGRRARKPAPPSNPDWEQDEPLTGLS